MSYLKNECTAVLKKNAVTLDNIVSRKTVSTLYIKLLRFTLATHDVTTRDARILLRIELANSQRLVPSPLTPRFCSRGDTDDEVYNRIPTDALAISSAIKPLTNLVIKNKYVGKFITNLFLQLVNLPLFLNLNVISDNYERDYDSSSSHQSIYDKRTAGCWPEITYKCV